MEDDQLQILNDSYGMKTKKTMSRKVKEMDVKLEREAYLLKLTAHRLMAAKRRSVGESTPIEASAFETQKRITQKLLSTPIHNQTSQEKRRNSTNQMKTPCLLTKVEERPLQLEDFMSFDEQLHDATDRDQEIIRAHIQKQLEIEAGERDQIHISRLDACLQNEQGLQTKEYSFQRAKLDCHNHFRSPQYRITQQRGGNSSVRNSRIMFPKSLAESTLNKGSIMIDEASSVATHGRKVTDFTEQSIYSIHTNTRNAAKKSVSIALEDEQDQNYSSSYKMPRRAINQAIEQIVDENHCKVQEMSETLQKLNPQNEHRARRLSLLMQQDNFNGQKLMSSQRRRLCQTPLVQKDRAIGKFLEISTLREPKHKRAFSRADEISSRDITSRIVQQTYQNDQHIALLQENDSFHVKVPQQTWGPQRLNYKFTKLREQYRDHYVQCAQQIKDVENKLQKKVPTNEEKPDLHQAYKSLYQNEAETQSKHDTSLQEPSIISETLLTSNTEQLITQQLEQSDQLYTQTSPSTFLKDDFLPHLNQALLATPLTNQAVQQHHLQKAPPSKSDKQRAFLVNYHKHLKEEQQKIQESFLSSYYAHNFNNEVFQVPKYNLSSVKQQTYNFFKKHGGAGDFFETARDNIRKSKLDEHQVIK